MNYLNSGTYRYFGEPVFTYSLKDGINDGFLAPFRVKQIQTTLDEFIHTQDDTVEQDQGEEGKRYEEKDFNRIIEIAAPEKKRANWPKFPRIKRWGGPCRRRASAH